MADVLDVIDQLKTDIQAIDTSITQSNVQRIAKVAFLSRIGGFKDHLTTLQGITKAYTLQYADYITTPEYITLTQKDKDKLLTLNTTIATWLVKLNNWLGL